MSSRKKIFLLFIHNKLAEDYDDIFKNLVYMHARKCTKIINLQTHYK